MNKIRRIHLAWNAFSWIFIKFRKKKMGIRHPSALIYVSSIKCCRMPTIYVWTMNRCLCSLLTCAFDSFLNYSKCYYLTSREFEICIILFRWMSICMQNHIKTMNQLGVNVILERRTGMVLNQKQFSKWDTFELTPKTNVKMRPSQSIIIIRCNLSMLSLEMQKWMDTCEPISTQIYFTIHWFTIHFNLDWWSLLCVTISHPRSPPLYFPSDALSLQNDFHNNNEYLFAHMGVIPNSKVYYHVMSCHAIIISIRTSS